MSTFKNSSVKSMVVMRKAFRSINARVSETFGQSGLTSTQFSVLDVLYSKGPLRICELIDTILATSGNMTVVIKNMEKKGWVIRESCPKDKRAYVVSLTPKGIDIIEQALPRHIESIEKVFSVLTEDERLELIRLLKKFKDL